MPPMWLLLLASFLAEALPIVVPTRRWHPVAGLGKVNVSGDPWGHGGWRVLPASVCVARVLQRCASWHEATLHGPQAPSDGLSPRGQCPPRVEQAPVWGRCHSSTGLAVAPGGDAAAGSGAGHGQADGQVPHKPCRHLSSFLGGPSQGSVSLLLPPPSLSPGTTAVVEVVIWVHSAWRPQETSWARCKASLVPIYQLS